MAAESSDYTSSDSSDDEHEDDEDEELEWRTFIDFTSEDSAANLTVKTFLRDCCKQPKILYHKSFTFFRNYLTSVGFNLDMPSNAPFSEEHEEHTFCVDIDDKWLNDLKSRLESPQDMYWASINPLQRKNDLGLIVFEWKSLPLTDIYLTSYIEFCQHTCENPKLTNSNCEDNTDEYIKDFKHVFDNRRNLDVEERYKGDVEAAKQRKANNKQEPGPSKELDALLKARISINRSKPNLVKDNAINGRDDTSDSSSSCSSSSESESDTSGDLSDCSEYKGYYVKERLKLRLKKKPKSETKPITNGVSKKPSRPNGLNGVKPNGTRPPTPKKSQTVKRLPCDICRTKSFATRKSLYKHLTRFHATSKRSLIACSCGRRLRKERLAFHQKSCKKAVKSKR